MYYMTFSFISCLVIGRALSVESNALREYDKKVCNNEPSCHLTSQQNFPGNRRTLEGRDCMCDFECVEYGDCCKDSEFYGANTASGNSYSCSPNSQIYMLTTCPTGYPNQAVASKCSASLQPLEGPDNSVIRPATNLKRRITYGNAYCALCNNDIEDVTLWNLSAKCGEAPAGYFDSQNRISQTSENNHEFSHPVKNSKPSFQIPSFGFNPGFQVQSPFGNNLKPNNFNPGSFLRRQKRQQFNVDYNKYRKELDNILENVRYDSNTNRYVSQYNGKYFVCEFASRQPEDFDIYVRYCVPNMVSSCPQYYTDEETIRKCSSETAIVYEKASKQSYKNKYCAICNNIPEISLTGCPLAERVAGSSLFSTSDKGASPPCDTPELKKKFC